MKTGQDTAARLRCEGATAGRLMDMPPGIFKQRGNTMREHELFYSFCRHLVEDENFDAEELLAVIEKPWKWKAEFQAFALAVIEKPWKWKAEFQAFAAEQRCKKCGTAYATTEHDCPKCW